MIARLTSDMRIKALIRRVNDEGGSAMVLARGDSMSGAILVLTLERGENPAFFERGIGPDGTAMLVASGPRTIVDDTDIVDYWQRRRRNDPDLWVIEVDIASGERLAADTII